MDKKKEHRFVLFEQNFVAPPRLAEGEEREGGGSGGGSGEGRRRGRRGARSEEVAAGGGIESRTEVRAGIGRGKRCRE